jgi:ubiquinone/menaquinone biosynthesis C-methylase UbiE
MTTAAPEPRYVPAAGRAWLTGSYDRTIALTMREERWRPALVAAAAADVPEGGDVLEVGCGTGSLALALASARPDASVVGADGDPSILALAQRKPGASGVRWVRALAGELPFEAASFDAAVCSLLLHHLDDPVKEQALADLARVLRPGGALHVADWGPPAGPLPAVGARVLQLFDGRSGPRSLLDGGMRLLLDACGFEEASRSGTLRTVWGTLELWRAVRA